jgi:hypothetical protein
MPAESVIRFFDKDDVEPLLGRAQRSSHAADAGADNQELSILANHVRFDQAFGQQPSARHLVADRERPEATADAELQRADRMREHKRIHANLDS